MGGLSKAMPPDKLLEGFRTEDFGRVLTEAFGEVAGERATRLLHVIEGLELQRAEGHAVDEWRIALIGKLRRELLEAIGDATRGPAKEE